MVSEKEIFEQLCVAVINYNEEEAKIIAHSAVEAKVNLVEGINLMSETLKGIGERFHSGELFLPHLVMAADAMMAAVHVFEKHIPKEERDKGKMGTIVMGTVQGDVHDVGLNIVSMGLLTCGFEVFNLGKDVSVDKFIERAEQVDADIIGASALLTVTMSRQKDLVDEVRSRNLPFKVMVGGGPVTRQWAEEIGADGYGADSLEAMESAKKLMDQKGKGK